MSQFVIMQLFYSRKNVVRHAVGVDHCVVRVSCTLLVCMYSVHGKFVKCCNFCLDVL